MPLPSLIPMKTARFLLSAGLLLATASAGFGQQPVAANNAVRVAANVSNAPVAAAPVVQGPPREYVLLTGGPSLTIWEKYKAVPHDNFWASFTRATRTRFQQIQAQQGNDPNAVYTWLVFEDGYKSRGEQDHQDYITDLNSVRDKYHLHMVPVRNGQDVINYLNNGQDRRRRVPGST